MSILACSGGPDSVYLLHQLLAQGERPILAHFNHHLRGKESRADEQFVQSLAKEHGLAFERGGGYVKSYAKRHKKSLEAAARDLRYRFLEKIRQKHQANAIFTAHHRDDQIETLLLQRKRGAHLKGKIGMQAQNGWIKRPLLNVSKHDILTWLNDHQIPYRIDASNADLRFERNRLRHTLAQKTAAQNVFTQKVLAEAEHAKLEYQIRTQNTEAWLKSSGFEWGHPFKNRLPLQKFRALSSDEQQFLLAHLYTLAQGSSLGLSTAQIMDVQRMLQRGHGGKKRRWGAQLEIQLEGKQMVIRPISS